MLVLPSLIDSAKNCVGSLWSAVDTWSGDHRTTKCCLLTTVACRHDTVGRHNQLISEIITIIVTLSLCFIIYRYWKKIYWFVLLYYHVIRDFIAQWYSIENWILERVARKHWNLREAKQWKVELKFKRIIINTFFQNNSKYLSSAF